MRILLASCNLELIKKYSRTGIFSGVITNPHVVAEEKRNPLELFKQVLDYVPYAYYPLDGGTIDKMLEEADRMLEIDAERIRIKVPATIEGFAVISRLVGQGVHVMATCVPTCAWMIFAIESGAKEFSPYSGMLQRRGLISKREEVIKMQRILDAQKYDVSICTGIYDVTDFPVYAEHGIRSCFVWGKDVEEFLTQPLVEEVVEGFRSSSETINTYY